MRLGALLALVLVALGAGCSSPRRPATGDDAGATLDDGSATADADLSTEGRLASGVTLDGLAVFQGTRVALFEAGAVATRNAPIVAGRRAVVRAYVDPGARAGQTFMGELEVREGSTVVSVLRDQRTLSGVSDDASPASVLSFDVPAELVTTTASLAVRIVDPAGDAAAMGASHAARLPRDGSFHALAAQSDVDGLHLVLVPLRWDGDGSGRLPDTSPAQIELFRALLLAVYPLVHVTIDVHDVVPWSDSLTFGGNVDFGAVNSMLMGLRASDAAPPGAYYYALANARDTYAQYCGSACTTGQSFVTDAPADADYRVGSGVGFSGENTAWTLVHEIGHEHGRSHAPCDTSGSDPAYPYAGGSIGVWGFDPRTSTFQDPSGVTDFMGYCDPTWTSDYTWSAIFERTVAVSALASFPREPSLLVRVGGEIGARISGTLSLRPPHSRDPIFVRWLDGRGQVISVASAPTLAQSHTDERLAVLPQPPFGAAAVVVNGRTLPLDP